MHLNYPSERALLLDCSYRALCSLLTVLIINSQAVERRPWIGTYPQCPLCSVTLRGPCLPHFGKDSFNLICLCVILFFLFNGSGWARHAVEWWKKLLGLLQRLLGKCWGEIRSGGRENLSNVVWANICSGNNPIHRRYFYFTHNSKGLNIHTKL